MADRSVRGRFVWRELSTPDVAGAHMFYSKALGWKTQSWDQDPSYSMFVGPSGPLGGSVQETTQPPGWLPFISTDDVAATEEEARAMGATVVKERTDMPNGGTYAVLIDPQGARFGVYTAANGASAQQDVAKPGEFSWNELAATDWRAAFDFYSKLFGWERIAEHDMGPMGAYLLFGWDGQQKGGMFDKPAGMGGDPMWLGYVRVKDLDRTLEKVKAARGSLINGPMEVPGGDWIAQFLDPYGAMFAAHAVAADVKTSGAPPREQEQTAPGAGKPKAGAAPRKPAGRPLEEEAAPAEEGAAPAKRKAPRRGRAAARTKTPAAQRKASSRTARKTAAKKKSAKKKSAKKSSASRSTAKAAGTAKKSTRKAAGRKAASKRSATKAKVGARGKAPGRRSAARGKTARKK
ncbi:MAG TPA: VOC family protein [Steroidobacter sp.]|nr:VOC family protein [Steroidobacter sp.]